MSVGLTGPSIICRVIIVLWQNKHRTGKAHLLIELLEQTLGKYKESRMGGKITPMGTRQGLDTIK